MASAIAASATSVSTPDRSRTKRRIALHVCCTPVVSPTGGSTPWASASGTVLNGRIVAARERPPVPTRTGLDRVRGVASFMGSMRSSLNRIAPVSRNCEESASSRSAQPNSDRRCVSRALARTAG